MAANGPTSRSMILARYTGLVLGNSGQAATSEIAGKQMPNARRRGIAMRLHRLSTSLLSAASDMGLVL